MAMKRLDMNKINGELKIIPKNGVFNIKKENDDFKIKSDSWTIVINKRRMYIHCSSNAINKKRDFNIPYMNGSLFLYNNTHNWYWNFRKKSLQNMLDKIQVDTIVNLDIDDHITIPTIVEQKKKYVYTRFVDEFRGLMTVKYFGDNVKTKIHVELYYPEKFLCKVMVDFSFNTFLLVNTKPGHNILYLKGVLVRDIFDKLKNAEMKFIEGVDECYYER